MIVVQRIDKLTFNILQPLLDASLTEGYSFIQTLWDEYDAGKVMFDEPGAVLLGAYASGQQVAIGGVHPDPYLNQPTIGRVRHVYVLPAYRRQGLGKQLVQSLITQGGQQFNIFTLRTLTDHGHAFYTDLGFSDEPRFADATHWLQVVEE